MLHFRNFYCLTIVKKSIFKFTSYMKPPFFCFSDGQLQAESIEFL